MYGYILSIPILNQVYGNDKSQNNGDKSDRKSNFTKTREEYNIFEFE